MSVDADNVHPNPAIIDNVSTIVGSDPIAILEDYVVDTLGGTFGYLDLAGTSYNPGTGAITGNVTFGNSLWTVTAGTAYVRTLPGSTFPYLEIPYGTTITQDVAGTVFLPGTDAESTLYLLDQLSRTGATADERVWSDETNHNVAFSTGVRYYNWGYNTYDENLVQDNVWHVSRKRTKWNVGFGRYATACGSTYDNSEDFWESPFPGLMGLPSTRCLRLKGANQLSGVSKSLIAAIITVGEDTVASGADATIKTLLRNATKLALSGGIWP